MLLLLLLLLVFVVMVTTCSRHGDDVRHCCALPVGCRMDNMGTEFVLAFINNLVENGTYQLEIYPTSFSRQPSVDVRVQLAAGGWDQSLQLPSSRSVMVDVPGEVELRGTEMSRKAVIVTTASDEAVGVYAMSSAERGSCDGFVALPVISLGVDHFVLCFFPPDHQSEIGIVAVHDSTTVSVTLRQQTRPGVRVTWNKTTYTNGQTFTISMSQYDTVQLQSLKYVHCLRCRYLFNYSSFVLQSKLSIFLLRFFTFAISTNLSV